MKQRALLIRFLMVWPVIASAAESAREIPRTWDDAEMAKHEIPRADPAGSPKYVSSDYYYKIPVRPIYKGGLRARSRAARLHGLAEGAGTGDRLG